LQAVLQAVTSGDAAIEFGEREGVERLGGYTVAA